MTPSPDATGPELDLSSQWLTWGTYGDDYVPAVFGRRRDPAGAKLFHERMALFMPLDGGTTPPPADAAERGHDHDVAGAMDVREDDLRRVTRNDLGIEDDAGEAGEIGVFGGGRNGEHAG